MHVLLIAEESIGINFIRYLSQSTVHQLTVMASHGRETLSGATTWSIAEQLGVPRIPAKEIKQPEFHKEISQRGIDVLISVRSRYIIPERVLAEPPLGAYNLHTGPLPAYAGINVINWAIYNGESRHGVTVHRMEEEVDSGVIAYTADVEIDAADSAAIVTKKCFRQSMTLLKRLIADLESDSNAIPSIKQDLHQRHWYGPEVPNNGFVPWQEGAKRSLDFIRACDYFPFPSPWGGAKTIQNGEHLVILKAKHTNERSNMPPGYVGEVSGSGVKVSAADDWLIVEEVLINDERAAASDILRTGSTLMSG